MSCTTAWLSPTAWLCSTASLSAAAWLTSASCCCFCSLPPRSSHAADFLATILHCRTTRCRPALSSTRSRAVICLLPSSRSTVALLKLLSPPLSLLTYKEIFYLCVYLLLSKVVGCSLRVPSPVKVNPEGRATRGVLRTALSRREGFSLLIGYSGGRNAVTQSKGVRDSPCRLLSWNNRKALLAHHKSKDIRKKPTGTNPSSDVDETSPTVSTTKNTSSSKKDK